MTHPDPAARANPRRRNRGPNSIRRIGRKRIVSRHRTPRSPAKDASGTKGAVQPAEDVELQQYLYLFKTLFFTFRQEVCELCGGRGEEIISRAKEKVRLQTPVFDLNALDQQAALSVLDLIETIIRNASIFKRSRLRQAALMQVSELYTRHYTLLEKFLAIDALEQFYFRLGK